MTKVRKFNKTGRSSLTDSVFASQRKGCGRFILVILMARVYPDMHAIKANNLLNHCYCTELNTFDQMLFITKTCPCNIHV